MSRASWSLALKSAAVSVANTVGSNERGSPIVATSCPERSAMSAEWAPVSERNFSTLRVRAARSSSSKDQVAAPGFVTRSGQGRFDVAHERDTALAESGVTLPGDVFAKKPDCAHRVSRAQITECGEPPERMPAEQVATILALKMTPCKRAAGRSRNESESGELPVTNGYHIARRAESACAIVTPSAYSRSPPTGSPRAMRVTVSWYGDNLR